MNKFSKVPESDFQYDRLGSIAYRQINQLPQEAREQVYQFTGRLYQQHLEGDTAGAVKVSLKHSSETNELHYSLYCPLSKAASLLAEAQKVIENLSDIYLDEESSCDQANTPNEDIKASLIQALTEAELGERLPLSSIEESPDESL
jgi:hypothetical protein